MDFWQEEETELYVQKMIFIVVWTFSIIFVRKKTTKNIKTRFFYSNQVNTPL